jgi:hypothetical protein
MKSLALGLSIFLVLVGAYASRKYQLTTSQEDKSDVLSTSQEARSEEVTPTEFPTQAPSSTQTPKPSSTTSVSSSSVNFKYPGAHTIQESQTVLVMESTEDTDKITDWYKSKIEDLGMNVKSFVTTKANDKILNKLSAADGVREINIEISKDSELSAVKISVALSNF